MDGERTVSFDGVGFWALYEMAQAIVSAVKWNKGAQIVLQYDPRSNRATFTVNQLPDESSGRED